MKRLFLTSLVFIFSINAEEQLASIDELLDGLHRTHIKEIFKPTLQGTLKMQCF